ncbi:MAG TPA: protein kinase [Polyangiaceae bacterium]|nr:protein kinase [Polyangiaceae bacterium]
MADIFISYSKKDLAPSTAVCELLRGEGYSVAIDRDFLVPGNAYRQVIAEQIREAKVVIVLWSTNAVESDFVRDEASHASRRTVLLPLIVDEMPETDVPLGFGELQYLRLKWAAEGQLNLDSRAELIGAVRRHLPAVEPLDAAVAQLKQEVNLKLGSEYGALEQIGTGRMSVVFKSQHGIYGVIALKVTPLAGILLVPGFYAEFRRSIDAARELSHPNILNIRDVKLLDTVACTVMDYVEGSTLARCLVGAAPRMTLGRIKSIATDIAQALTHAHASGIVHSNLSPSNILIETPLDRALVSDFGVPAVGAGPEASAAKALFLDARYMSPEQCLGDPATPQSDQYSLGAILYEMLSGRPPFVGRAAYTIMRGHCTDTPTPIAELRPECPPQVAGTVMRMLEKRPKDRYLTTGMLAREIESWPLAESVRSGASPTRGAAHSAKLALESYNRCLVDPNFLAAFYQRLNEDPRLARHLENMMFDRQVEALKRSIRHLLEYAQGQEDARRELERVAVAHQRFKLEEPLLLHFIDILIELALERDPSAAEAGQRELLRAAWRTATEAGLARFAELAQVSQPRASSVVAVGETPVEPSQHGSAEPH